MEEQITRLIKEMEKSNLSNLDIEFPDGLKISMKKEYETRPQQEVIVTKKVTDECNQVTETKIAVKQEEKEGNIVKSPMVGTCYLKPAPNAEEFVKKGCKVKKGDILCIVEAMKLMNEIEAEFDGEVVEILISNSESVEYGKPLFRIV